MKISFKDASEFEIERYVKEFTKMNGSKVSLRITLKDNSTSVFNSLCEKVTDENLKEITIVGDESNTETLEGYIFESVLESTEVDNRNIMLNIYKNIDKEEIK